MHLTGTQNQISRDTLFCADVTLTGSAQLVLAQSLSRGFLMLQNIGSHAMQVEFGSARGVATISSGGVSSVAVSNAGFNFTKPPVVRFFGGGNNGNSSYLGLNQANGASPSHVAQAHAVLTGGAVSSIVVDDPGSGYVIAPYVFIYDSDLDPYGAALPSATSGIVLPANMSAPISFQGVFCTTDPISVLGTADDILVCRWAP